MKYRAIPTVVDGIRFASKKEAMRYWELRLLERSGTITGLELQPKFPLRVQGAMICTYIADFRYTYRDGPKPVLIVEDVKGVRTPVYRIKKKLFEAIYAPLKITET